MLLGETAWCRRVRLSRRSHPSSCVSSRAEAHDVCLFQGLGGPNRSAYIHLSEIDLVRLDSTTPWSASPGPKLLSAVSSHAAWQGLGFLSLPRTHATPSLWGSAVGRVGSDTRTLTLSQPHNTTENNSRASLAGSDTAVDAERVGRHHAPPGTTGFALSRQPLTQLCGSCCGSVTPNAGNWARPRQGAANAQPAPRPR